MGWMPEPEEERPLAGRHERPTCYQETAEHRAIWAGWEAEFADTSDAENWGGADEHEITEEEWAEAAALQAAEAAADPVYARMLDMVCQSPAMRPWSPPPPDDDA